jgi:hypothetical protein
LCLESSLLGAECLGLLLLLMLPDLCDLGEEIGGGTCLLRLLDRWALDSSLLRLKRRNG